MSGPANLDLRHLLGAPVRAAFVGQSTFFEACSLEQEPGARVGVAPRFIEYRDGVDFAPVRAELDEYRPDITVVFRPEIVPAGALHDLPGAVLGYLTEPLPRRHSGAVEHRDLESRLRDLRRIDPMNVDRVISFDPMIAKAAGESVEVWRSVPLPVADRFYRPVGDPVEHPHALFVGRSTPHREKLLREAKDEGLVLHLGFGVDSDHLQELMAGHGVAVNIHNEPYPTFENRVSLHLAAGQLLLTEPLDPTHGLEPEIDYLTFVSAGILAGLLDRLSHVPGIWHDVRLRGRRKAEMFRASHVYPRVFFDLLTDLKTRPSLRPAPAVNLMAGDRT